MTALVIGSPCSVAVASRAAAFSKAIKVCDAEMDAINLSREDFRKWNYTTAPMLTVTDEANRPAANREVDG
ncbi:hypothetical protein [Rhizobium sp. PL01]|uniref:hypothetical protein n=1 Tax=Rhizobium sp. PL01 TaxID=3085631 RepID=UPI0029823DE1|nr:hypothetical protein [Rhizobium sp. PL01]MDW5318497.1 hypothetical protein [Rhizobium sp. PL01]